MYRHMGAVTIRVRCSQRVKKAVSVHFLTLIMSISMTHFSDICRITLFLKHLLTQFPCYVSYFSEKANFLLISNNLL